MILRKEYYIRASIFKRFWIKRQLRNLSKSSKLFTPGAWKSSRPALRSRHIPKFVGSKNDLLQFKDAKKLEAICPTAALEVAANTILINEKNCIGCQECVKASPEGLFEASQEKFHHDPETN